MIIQNECTNCSGATVSVAGVEDEEWEGIVFVPSEGLEQSAVEEPLDGGVAVEESLGLLPSCLREIRDAGESCLAAILRMVASPASSPLCIVLPVSRFAVLLQYHVNGFRRSRRGEPVAAQASAQT